MPRNINVHAEMIEYLAVRMAEDQMGTFEPKAGDDFRWLGASAYSDADTIQREATLTAADIAEAKNFVFRLR